MTVKELKKELKGITDNYIVVMSKDSEGNSYSPLYQLDKVKYLPETTYDGVLMDSDEQLLLKVKDNAVCLWPTN
jgi:hypothetical protein